MAMPPRPILLPSHYILANLPTQPQFLAVLHFESALEGHIVAKHDPDRRSRYLSRAVFGILNQTVNAVSR